MISSKHQNIYYSHQNWLNCNVCKFALKDKLRYMTSFQCTFLSFCWNSYNTGRDIHIIFLLLKMKLTNKPWPKDRTRHCMYSLSQWNCVLSYSCVNMYMKSIVLSIKVHQLFDKRDTDFLYFHIHTFVYELTKLLNSLN